MRAAEGQFWQSAHVGSGHMGTLCTDRMTDRQTVSRNDTPTSPFLREKKRLCLHAKKLLLEIYNGP